MTFNFAFPILPADVALSIDLDRLDNIELYSALRLIGNLKLLMRRAAFDRTGNMDSAIPGMAQYNRRIDDINKEMERRQKAEAEEKSRSRVTRYGN